MCWLKGAQPGYVVNCKSVLFIKEVSTLVCKECNHHFTIKAAAQAVDAQENKLGPLAFVDLTLGRIPNQALAVVTCSHCGHQLTVDAMDGFPV